MNILFVFFASLISNAFCFQVPLRLGYPIISGRLTQSVANTNTLLLPHSSKERIIPLNMAEEPVETSDEKNDVEETSKPKKAVSPQKLEGRKKRVIGGYKILAAAYGFFGFIMLGLTKNPFYSSGPLLAAGISYILIGAAENNRLSSDTYKRLNLALIEYGFVGFMAGICMKLNLMWKIGCFIAFVNSIKGYGYGLKGWELAPASAKDDLINGMKANFKSMLRIPNMKSLGYSAATLTVGYLKLAKLVEVMKLMVGGSAYTLGTRLFSLSRLMITTIVLYTLKDAADRDRLEGTTFIELNALAFLCFATWAVYEKLSTPFGKLFAFFSVFTASNGVLSIMNKKNSK